MSKSGSLLLFLRHIEAMANAVADGRRAGRADWVDIKRGPRAGSEEMRSNHTQVDQAVPSPRS